MILYVQDPWLRQAIRFFRLSLLPLPFKKAFLPRFLSLFHLFTYERTERESLWLVCYGWVGLSWDPSPVCCLVSPLYSTYAKKAPSRRCCVCSSHRQNQQDSLGANTQFDMREFNWKVQIAVRDMVDQPAARKRFFFLRKGISGFCSYHGSLFSRLNTKTEGLATKAFHCLDFPPSHFCFASSKKYKGLMHGTSSRVPLSRISDAQTALKTLTKRVTTSPTNRSTNKRTW